MGGEPGDHRNAEPFQVIRELVQLGTIELRFPETSRRAMEDIHTGIGQWLEELTQGLRGLYQAGGVVLLLPLGETEDDREARADRSAHGLNQLNGKT